MKILLLSIIVLLQFSGKSYSQDIIYKTDGSKISGKIYDEDSLKIYYTITDKRTVFNTSIDKSDIRTINYGTKTQQAKLDDIITRKDGKTVVCKIQKEDDTDIFFIINRNDQVINTSIKKSNILSISYGKQVTKYSSPVDQVSLGIGLGFDFGGLGGALTIYPQHNIGLFIGVGTVFVGVGYNVGVKLRLLSAENPSRVYPFIVGMYGYNTAIAVVDSKNLNKLFYGPTLGFGIDYRQNYTRKVGYWSFAILVPIRSGEVDTYIDKLKSDYGVKFQNDLIPLGISFGYRFIIN